MSAAAPVERPTLRLSEYHRLVATTEDRLVALPIAQGEDGPGSRELTDARVSEVVHQRAVVWTGNDNGPARTFAEWIQFYDYDLRADKPGPHKLERNDPEEPLHLPRCIGALAGGYVHARIDARTVNLRIESLGYRGYAQFWAATTNGAFVDHFGEWSDHLRRYRHAEGGELRQEGIPSFPVGQMGLTPPAPSACIGCE